MSYEYRIIYQRQGKRRGPPMAAKTPEDAHRKSSRLQSQAVNLPRVYAPLVSCHIERREVGEWEKFE